MTEAEFLKVARDYRDVCLWTDRLPTAELKTLMDAAMTLEDITDPEWTTAYPLRNGIYWVRWNEGKPYLVSFWDTGGVLACVPLNTSVQGPEDGVGIEWWPVRVKRPEESE